MLLLAMYTFVFSIVFKARWGSGESESKAQFAMLLFAGMIVHGMFAETLQRMPTIIISNVNYVKKIVFPLEILPVMALCSALFHAIVSATILIMATALLNGTVAWTMVYLPIVLLPLVVLTQGLAWMLAWLGVYLRDVAQPIGHAMTVLLFASPVFYPLTALPIAIRPWLMLNPLTFIIEQARDVLIYGNTPNYYGLAIYSLVAIFVAWIGYASFQKTRKGFANVL
jgi:lipopolysaccharide transport system permease protein